jgi:flagellar basal body-associated protein FliL
VSSSSVIIVIYVLAVLFLVGLITYATVAIRRWDEPVKKPRAITAEYETKELPPFHDWESYYDVRDTDFRPPRRGDGSPPSS